MEITKKANRRMFLPEGCYTTRPLRPLLEYSSPIWGGIPQYLAEEIKNIQSRCLRILGIPKDSLPPLHERRDKQTIEEYERIYNDKNSSNNLIPSPVYHPHNLRCQTTKRRPFIRAFTDRHKQSFTPGAISLLF